MKESTMKLLVFKLFLLMQGVTCFLSPLFAQLALTKFHNQINQAMASSEQMSVQDLIKKNTQSFQQGPLVLDIQETEGGVKLIKGIKRQNSLLETLFWCKQEELVDLLEKNFEQGAVVFAELLNKRSSTTEGKLILFMTEILYEDKALTTSEKVAVGKEIEDIQNMRRIFDRLLLGLSKLWGISN